MIGNAIAHLIAKFILIFGHEYDGLQNKIYSFILEKVVGYRKSVVNENITNSFAGISALELKQRVKLYYRHMAHYILDTLFAYHGNEKQLLQSVHIKNGDLIQNEIKAGNNVIILSGHYGNWELISMVLPVELKVPVYAVYKPLSSKFIDQYVKNKRQRFGLGLLPMNEVTTFLQRKQPYNFVMLFVADQSPAYGQRGEWIQFLNQHTLFLNGAATLKKRYDLKIFYQRCIVNNGKYALEFIPMETDVIKNYAKLLEEDIIKNPDPWLWSHRRWKNKRTS
jgi:Kdo2-lipid IVA lauroyltransferase/acyltransferase